MKKFLSFAIVAVMALAMSSCSSVSYTARNNKVNLHNLTTPKMEAGTRVDFTYRVTATSKARKSLKDAKNEAIYLCIKNQHVDFVVDPIFEIQLKNKFFTREYTATVVGYAGYFTDAAVIVPATPAVREEKPACAAPCYMVTPCCGHHDNKAPKAEEKPAKPAKKAKK